MLLERAEARLKRMEHRI
jgi:hypothetical protein